MRISYAADEDAILEGLSRIRAWLVDEEFEKSDMGSRCMRRYPDWITRSNRLCGLCPTIRR